MREIINKLKSIPQGAKASIAFFCTNVVTMGIAYITTPLYTRLLSPDEYGQASVFLTWHSMFDIVATFSLAAGVFNNGMVDYPDKRGEYSLSMLALSNIFTVCCTAVLLCAYPFLKTWIGLDVPLIVLMGVICFFRPAYKFWSARQRYELKYKKVVVWLIVFAVFSPLVAIICILIFQDNRLYARIFGAELSLVAIYIGFYIYMGVKNHWKVETKYWRAALLFNLPLIPHYLSGVVLGSSDKIMISALVGDSATAYYSIAYAVASVAGVIWSATNASLIPFTYEKCKKKEFSSISGVVIPLLAVCAVGCILVMLLAPEVVAIMATPDYREAIYAIPPVIGGVFFTMHYNIYGNILYYYKKPKYVVIASLSSAALNLVLNYMFIPVFGYIAAGYTTLFCYLFQSALNYWGMRRVVGDIQIYNMKYLGALSLGVIAVTLLGNLVYSLTWLRYGIILLLLVLCVVFHKKLIGIFKRMRKGG